MKISRIKAVQKPNRTLLGKNANKIFISNVDETAFSLIEATEILSKPLTIILENEEYDAHFLNAIINNYKEGQKIKEHYNNGWLQYRNGGGHNIPNVISGMKERFEKNKSNYPKDSAKYIRAFVIIDSDKKYPSDDKVVADDKVALLDIIKQNLPYHVMLKREMENYLPDEVIAEIPDNEDLKKAFFELTPTQKDFFDLEKGLPDKNFDKLDDNIQNLYSEVSDTSKKVLRKSGLTFYKENGKKGSFKANFSALFLSQNVTKRRLERRANSTNSNELHEILKKISKLL